MNSINEAAFILVVLSLPIIYVWNRTRENTKILQKTLDSLKKIITLLAKK